MGDKTKQAPTSKQEERFLRIKLVRSLIGRPPKHREVARGLGLRKLNSVVTRKDCPEIRGMINKIPHLVEVEVIGKK
ncbi:MAG: 50S ribosomal protein L30 [Candidatus Aminicenantes bacterium 4484_214]|nr:MAG: 50S ribosomal protein L30 [Candidatus Aminicenantes bacterium 4484_214]RLE09893.1 MAG: 50S ribosomal protein L30 [Candidatus Aminicenantes bacterium]HDJ23550.1 50S ribosomal protein L30 [Candidatus Aminicenantes bacterium]